ncbi:hypothetical protein EJ110_NYTH00404 [Nymphaea thermarum]|nr:hypothetical protein EJ110_NYTH00404 [Nymphaea thermarum]
MSGCFIWRSKSRSPNKASRPSAQEAKDSGSSDSFRLGAGEFTDVHTVPASVTRSGKSSMATSATSSHSGEVALPPEEYLTLYVGPGRKEYKVPLSFRDYESFKQLLKEAKREQNCEIVEDVGGAILLDSVKLEYFEFVKKNIEWKEKEKRALEKSYCDALWTRQK